MFNQYFSIYFVKRLCLYDICIKCFLCLSRNNEQNASYIIYMSTKYFLGIYQKHYYKYTLMISFLIRYVIKFKLWNIVNIFSPQITRLVQITTCVSILSHLLVQNGNFEVEWFIIHTSPCFFLPRYQWKFVVPHYEPKFIYIIRLYVAVVWLFLRLDILM